MHSLLTILCRFDSLSLASVWCKDTRVQRKKDHFVSLSLSLINRQSFDSLSLTHTLFLLLFAMPLPMHMSISYVRIKCKWISENVLWHYLHAKCLELLCKFVGACVNCISKEGRKFFFRSELKFQFSGQRAHCAMCMLLQNLSLYGNSIFVRLFLSHCLCYWTAV